MWVGSNNPLRPDLWRTEQSYVNVITQGYTKAVKEYDGSPRRVHPYEELISLRCVRKYHASTSRLRIVEAGDFFRFQSQMQSNSQLGRCFPTQEASMVPRDQRRLCDHHRSSSCALLPWIVVPGVQHAYPLTGLALIWGQTHENNNLSSPHLPTGHWFYWPFFPLYSSECLFFASNLILVNICEVTRCVCFLFLSLKISSPPSLSLSLSPPLSLFPSSMWTLARDFIRGIPAAELQQAFPGEKAAGSRRMIKLGHYLASAGP